MTEEQSSPAAHLLGVVHAGISVRDMEEALDWYKRNLGFHLVKDDGFVPPLRARICFVERDGFQLELFRHEDPRPIPADRLLPDTDLCTIGTKHIAFRVDDIDAMKAQLLQNGVDIAHEVRMNGDAVMFIRDPSGVLIELIQA